MLTHLKPLAAEAAEELRLNPPANALLPKTRAFADALNREVSKKGKFDPLPWGQGAKAGGGGISPK